MKNQRVARYNHLLGYLYAYIALLLVAHWVTVHLTLYDSAAAASNWAVWFDLDREYNVPTVTNAVILGLSGLVALKLATRVAYTIQRLGWFLFALLFGYFSLDEMLIIHEQAAEPLRKLLDISGSNPLYHAWVIPALVAIVLLMLLVFVIRRYYRQLKIFSDILVLIIILASGVVLLEIIGTFVYSHTEAYRLLIVPAEEVFELSMAAMILKSLLASLHKTEDHGKIKAV